MAHTDHVKSLERAVPFDHLRDGRRGEEHVAGVHKQHALCAALCANPLHEMSEVRETALPVGPGGRKGAFARSVSDDFLKQGAGVKRKEFTQRGGEWAKVCGMCEKNKRGLNEDGC